MGIPGKVKKILIIKSALAIAKVEPYYFYDTTSLWEVGSFLFFISFLPVFLV